MKKSIGYFVAFLFATLCVVTLSFATADAEEATVIASYYEDDVAVVLTTSGEVEKFDRDDLIPGDKLELKDDDYAYLGGEYISWYSVEVKSVVVADFLYEKDAMEYASATPHTRVYHVECIK